MDARVFTVALPVRFKHCDPAGIAFYPRLVEFANDTVESWFAELGVGFPVLIGERGLGVPAVTLNARFLKPCRHGEVLQGRLRPIRLGDRSLELGIVLAGPESDPRVKFDLTLVCVERNAVASRPWPEDLRAAISGWLTVE